MLKKKELINPEEVMYANLARLTSDDIRNNKTENFNLRCTNLSYIAGNLVKEDDDKMVFIDTFSKSKAKYPYFKTVTEAENALLTYEENNDLFVIYARPLTEIGIRGIKDKAIVRNMLNRCGLYFNFSDDEKEENKIRNKLRK